MEAVRVASLLVIVVSQSLDFIGTGLESSASISCLSPLMNVSPRVLPALRFSGSGDEETFQSGPKAALPIKNTTQETRFNVKFAYTGSIDKLIRENRKWQ
jgi:hypothetical protein